MEEIDSETWQEIYNILDTTNTIQDTVKKRKKTGTKKKSIRRKNMTEEERKQKRREDVKMATRRLRQRQKDEIILLRRKLSLLQEEGELKNRDKVFDNPNSANEWREAVIQRNGVLMNLEKDHEHLMEKLNQSKSMLYRLFKCPS